MYNATNRKQFCQIFFDSPFLSLVSMSPVNIRLGEDLLKTPWRRLEDVFNSTNFCLPRILQDVFKTYSRRVCKKSWRRFENVFKKMSRKSLENILNTSCKDALKMFWRRLENIFRRILANTSWKRLEDVLKTSWKKKNCYVENVFETSSRRLGKQEMFAGKVNIDIKIPHHIKYSNK